MHALCQLLGSTEETEESAGNCVQIVEFKNSICSTAEGKVSIVRQKF